MADPLNKIVEAIKRTLEPILNRMNAFSCNIVERGIMLAGEMPIIILGIL